MKKTLLLFVLSSFAILPCGAQKKGAKATPSPEVTTETHNGLFTITKDKKKEGTDWFFSIPDSLLGREFLVTFRYTSTPANRSETYGGELANELTVYFEMSPEDKLLLRSNILVSAADTADAINRAVRISNENPIISSFKVESHKNGMYKVKVNDLFLGTDAPLSINKDVKTKFGLSYLVKESSFIESMKTFPLNTEIRTLQTWVASGGRNAAAAITGKVTLGMNVSFVLLPKEPMRRRLFDPRVGYFADNFTKYSDRQQRVENVRFITRWRLEPKNREDAQKMKRGELVEPKKPIIFYIDPATPKQWRPYLILGVNDWQKAFEQAGFKNAIMAREWPENDSTMSMEDARYSCIRYLASPTENAYGPNVHDPRSGEIIESHICWYHNVMSLVHDWYMIQAGTIDEAARQMKFNNELMGQLIRFVSSHEVGHTLGLRHNFGSSSTVPVDSLRSRDFVVKYGHTPSIMDYARFNYVAQPEDRIPRKGIFPRIGDYDCWAIKWGYTPMWHAYDETSDHWELERLTSETLKNNRRLWFGDGETNKTRDSRCQTEDLGDDAVKASYYGLKNLKRIVPQLPEWTYQSNDIYSANLQDVYYNVGNQFYRYLNHVLRNIGGKYCDYKTVDESGAVYTDAPRSKQLAAFDFLDKNILHEPSWLIAPPYVKRLIADPQSYIERLGTNVVNNMLAPTLLEGMNDNLPVSEYLPKVVNSLFKEATTKAKVSPYRLKLQQTALERLIEYYNLYKTPTVASEVYKQLKRLQRMCHAASSNAQFDYMANQLDKALAIDGKSGK